jgi:hypothetical protein
MRLRHFAVACLVVCFACLFALLPSAAPQEKYDRDAYAREYVQFLVQELDQWTKGFPRQFYSALLQPPRDSSKLSESAKAGPGDLGDSVKRLASLSSGKDILTNDNFRTQVDKTLAAAKETNQAMASQRFPDPLQSDWDQIRIALNSLAEIYKFETLAALEPPGGPGRGGRGAQPAAAATVAVALPPGAVAGYIVDQKCSAQGKGMWTNVSCVERCVRDGDKLVLVTEEGKVFQIANQDKITSDTYGQKVIVTGKTEGEIITIESLKTS